MLDYKYSDTERLEASLVFNATNYDMYGEMANNDCNLWVRDTKNIDTSKLKSCYELHGKAIVVLGDSHAMNLFNIFSYSGTYDFVIGVSQGGCRPHSNKDICHYDNFDKFAVENSGIIDLVVYHQSGSYFIKSDNGDVDNQLAFEGRFGGYAADNIDEVISYLKSFSETTGTQVFWIGPFLEYRRVPNEILFSEEIKVVNPQSIKLFTELEKLLISKLKKFPEIAYSSFHDIFHEPRVSFNGDCFVFRDTDHFSKCGEILIGKSLRKDLINDRLETEKIIRLD